MHKLFRMHWWTFLLLATCVTLTSRPAEAIPAFARQTGQPCTACHIGGFGPQLTPLGRAFKIGGYTQGGGEGIGSMIPLSLMIQASFNHTGDDQFVSNGNGGLTPFQQHYAANNNFSLDQISGFLGGHIGDHVGGFAQFTWSDVDNTASVDNMDLRPFTTLFNVGGKDLRVGITLNNAPTVQDPYNTTFSWGFPFISSLIVPQPAADVFLSSGFDHSALGYTVYAWYDTKLYLEAGVYSTMSPWLLPRFGNGIAAGRTTSPAPYFRAAYEWQWDKNAAHIGATFLHADVRPLRSPDDDAFTTTGDFGTDHYTDYGLDAGYQFLGDGTHIVTVQGMFVHEEQNLKASASQIPIDGHFNLNQIRANVSYWYQNTYGLTLGWQKTWGPPNPVLVDSANNKPNTNAFIVEADWVPFGKDNSFLAPNVNLKLGLQYTAYTEFNGGGSNFDGAGHNASGNNTLLLFVWLIF